MERGGCHECSGWQWLPPGMAITLAVLAINFMGDGLRDALDVRSRHGGI